MATIPKSPTFSMHVPAPCAEEERAIQNRAHPGSAAASAPQTLGHRKWNDDRTQRSQALASVAGSPTGESPIWDRNRLPSLAVARRSALGTAGIQVAAAAATPPRAPWPVSYTHLTLPTILRV